MFGLLSEYMEESVESLKQRLGTQSLRSGGATMVAAKGVLDRRFQRHGGWRTPHMKDHYVQDTLDARLAVTRAIEY